MENKTDKWAWLKRSEHHYLLPFVIVVTFLVALWLLFFAHSSVLNWIRARMEEQRQEKEIERLKTEIGEMDAEIERLSSNRDSLEKFARETYHFAAPGEDIYIVE